MRTLEELQDHPGPLNWWTADPHFFHENLKGKSILDYCPQRPAKTMPEMHEMLIERWNSRVRPIDTIYVLGDAFFKHTEASKEVMRRLNGYKVLVLGNHDRSFKAMLNLGFNEVHDRLRIYLGGHQVQMSHYPYEHGQVPRHLEKYGPLFTKYEGLPLLHGHVHAEYKVCPNPGPDGEEFGVRSVNVGVDVWDCYPVSEDQVMQALFGDLG